MNLRRAVFFMLVTGAFSLQVGAQTLAPKEPFVLNLDYSRFRYDDQSCYLEIYYGFHPQHLTYDISEDNYRGGVKLSTRIRELSTDELAVDETSFLRISEKDTGGVWFKFPFMTQAGFVVSHGTYSLEVTASDSLDPSRVDSLKLNLEIEPFGSVPAVSDLELCKQIARSKDKKDLFYKNSLEVVPYPSLIFGPSTVPALFHYLELYNLDTEKDLTVRTEILDSGGELVREHSKKRKFKSANSIEVGTTPVSAYVSGKYQFRLNLLDENENMIAGTEKTFFIFNPHVQISQEGTTLERAAFDALTGVELDYEFQQARYIATEEEIELFNMLDSPEGKQTFLLGFWRDVSAPRRDLPAINRNAYLRRAQLANSRFGNFRKEGWETDRGRVLMIYAEPDEIERPPQEIDKKAYVVWRYFGIENGVEFVFIDRLGFGTLELVHSTKRGEFMDNGWERYLQ